MATDTRIPMMGQSIDTANPLQQLARGVAEKQRYDEGVTMQKDQIAYGREQDALDRQRQAKMDNATLASKDLNDQLTREQIVNAQFKNLDQREQSRIRSVAIAAAQVKPFLDANDTEGALNFALQRQASLHARMGKGENIDDEDTAAFIKMLQDGDIDNARNHVNAMVQVGQMTGALQMPKANAAVPIIDPVSGEVTYGAPPKAMPASALKMQNEALDGLATANNIQADLGTAIQQLDAGTLKLGPVSNVVSNIQNATNLSDEASRNYGSFRSSLEKLRNDSLRLNKGVQTEGDAVRAWNELFQNLNDEKLVRQRLVEIQNINQRAADLRTLEVDNIRSNYNQPPIDYSNYQKGSALGTQQPTTQPATQNTGGGGIKFLGFEGGQ